MEDLLLENEITLQELLEEFECAKVRGVKSIQVCDSEQNKVIEIDSFEVAMKHEYLSIGHSWSVWKWNIIPEDNIIKISKEESFGSKKFNIETSYLTIELKYMLPMNEQIIDLSEEINELQIFDGVDTFKITEHTAAGDNFYSLYGLKIEEEHGFVMIFDLLGIMVKNSFKYLCNGFLEDDIISIEKNENDEIAFRINLCNSSIEIEPVM